MGRAKKGGKTLKGGNHGPTILLKMAAAVLKMKGSCPLFPILLSLTTLLSTQPSSLDTTK